MHLRILPLALLSLTLSATPADSPAASSKVLAPGAELKLLADSFSFTEGPTSDAEGNVYFTDQPNDRILKWSVDGKLSTFLQPSGRANGMFFDQQGQLIACADEKNELWSIAPDGSHKVLVTEYGGKLLNAPNDLWVHPNGSLYFTDPFYKRDYWKRGPMEQDGQHVYWLSADRKTLLRVTSDLKQPNGITGTPDGKTLYVADIGAGKTYAYEIEASGGLAKKRLFCEMGSDGVTLDSEGNVYLTGRGVTVFNKTGEKIENIPVPGGWTANVSFGGKDHRTLFITASKALYSIQTTVKGANPSK
jgi:gluconolactonase